MSTFVFSSEEELLNQAKRDHACQVGLNWVKEQESLETIIKEIPLEYRIWCLEKGYSQFIDDCPWEQLRGFNWAYILSKQPQLSKFYSCWEQLNGYYWSIILSKQPQFSEHCDWEKIRGWDWVRLLSKQPQMSEYCDWEKLDRWDWVRLLSKQPQFSEYCDWEKLDGENWIKLLSKQPQFAKFRK